MNATSFL
jgi:hypothetical protein